MEVVFKFYIKFLNYPVLNTDQLCKCKEEMENFSQAVAKVAAKKPFQTESVGLTWSLSFSFGTAGLYLFMYLVTKRKLLSIYNRTMI